MNPNAAVNITARDKTGAGIKSAERSISGLVSKTSAAAKRSGLGVIGNQIEGLTRIRGLGRGFEEASRGFSILGSGVSTLGRSFAGASAEATALGMAGETGLGLVGGAAIGATTAVVGLGLAIGAAAAGTYMLAEKWSKLGAGIGRTAESIGISVTDLQAAIATGERFGVTADQTTGGIDGLATSLYDAKTGANNLAAGALTQLGVKLKQTKDGAVDVHQAMLDIADAIARQKDPQVQRKIAGIFGMTGMLPVLRKGSAAIRAEEADYTGSKLGMTPADIAQAENVLKKQVTVRQHIGRAEKDLGVTAMNATDSVLGDHPEVLADRVIDASGRFGKEVVDSGRKAGQALVDGARRAYATTVNNLDGFEEFAQRIERQESRGRQFDRNGKPLTSSAGAIGVMQVMPETGERAARRAGVRWDPEKFRNDENYNRMIGRLELRRLFDKYQGNQVLAASGYNAGEGRPDKWVKRFGDPRKGEISNADFAARIPFSETRDYVAKTARMDRTTPPAPVVIQAQGPAAPAPAQPQGRAVGAATAHYAPPTPQGRSAMAQQEPTAPQRRPSADQQEPTAPQGRPSSARVDIHLHNAPKGTVAHVSGAPGVTPTLRVMRALDD